MEESSNDIFEQYPLMDANDHEILMHREVHFGGQFSVMLEYYKKGGKGVQPEFNIERIAELEELEATLKQNLAVLFLSGSEAERIAEAKEAYRKLRAIYEIKGSKSHHPRLIADLILAEDEDAEAEVQAIVAEKNTLVPMLIDLLGNEQFYDSLYPGYGQAPTLAAKCLGLIGDKRAIIALFESFGQSDFFSDEQIIKALRAIGEPAKQFLLRVVAGHPINEDNERAAIALIQFREADVALACFKLLQDPEVQKDPCLPTYLVLACEALKGTPQEKDFIALANQQSISRQLREDMKAIMHSWEESLSEKQEN